MANRIYFRGAFVSGRGRVTSVPTRMEDAQRGRPAPGQHAPVGESAALAHPYRAAPCEWPPWPYTPTGSLGSCREDARCRLVVADLAGGGPVIRLLCWTHTDQWMESLNCAGAAVAIEPYAVGVHPSSLLARGSSSEPAGGG